MKAELLRGFWYMALPGARLRPGKLAHLKMLGEPVVVGRGRDNRVFALRDICPHRGIPLHYGRFDREGTCVDVPSMTAEQKIDMSKIRCGAFPAVERQGIVWVYFARDGEQPSGETAAPPRVPIFA